jgi:hypothetical protein
MHVAATLVPSRATHLVIRPRPPQPPGQEPLPT